MFQFLVKIYILMTWLFVLKNNLHCSFFVFKCEFHLISMQLMLQTLKGLRGSLKTFCHSLHIPGTSTEKIMKTTSFKKLMFCLNIIIQMINEL